MSETPENFYEQFGAPVEVKIVMVGAPSTSRFVWSDDTRDSVVECFSPDAPEV